MNLIKTLFLNDKNAITILRNSILSWISTNFRIKMQRKKEGGKIDFTFIINHNEKQKKH